MKECPKCGRLNFTGLHSARGGIPLRIIIFPQKRDCIDCGYEMKESGWFERGHF
jgi:uncharacterized OB-fold protein